MNSLANIEVVATVSKIEVKAAVAAPEKKLKAATFRKAVAGSGNTSSNVTEAQAAEAEVVKTDEAQAAEAEISVEAEAEIEGDVGTSVGQAGEAIPEEAVGEEFAGDASEELNMDETAGMNAGLDTGMNEGNIAGDYVKNDPSVIGGDMDYNTGMMVDPAAGTKGSLLSSWPFVIGISSAVLVVSIALGALLARRKIKKGIELYED